MLESRGLSLESCRRSYINKLSPEGRYKKELSMLILPRSGRSVFGLATSLLAALCMLAILQGCAGGEPAAERQANGPAW